MAHSQTAAPGTYLIPGKAAHKDEPGAEEARWKGQRSRGSGGSQLPPAVRVLLRIMPVLQQATGRPAQLRLRQHDSLGCRRCRPRAPPHRQRRSRPANPAGQGMWRPRRRAHKFGWLRSWLEALLQALAWQRRRRAWAPRGCQSRAGGRRGARRWRSRCRRRGAAHGEGPGLSRNGLDAGKDALCAAHACASSVSRCSSAGRW